VKRCSFLAPNSEQPYAITFVVKKIISIALIVLAVSLASLEAGGDPPNAIYDDETASSVRLGLSRQRPAFRKALNMLAEAAPKNQRLADYYQRVTSRVKGDNDDHERNVGAGMVVTVPKSKMGRPDVTDISSTENSIHQSQTSSSGLMPSAQAAVITGPGSMSGLSTEAESESPTNAQLRLTVGDIEFDTNPAIEEWMNYYAATPRGRSTLRIGIERSNAYLEMARAEFRNAGVPEDLVWLACVESVWNPRAVSPAAAGGIWQFIPATASEYGLTVTNGNDERADPYKQTRVAAAYLRDLYTIFGDWTLAMAAYNSGEPRVMGAIVKNGNANFWELYEKQLLPKETCHYIPKILATIKLASQAEVYGFFSEAEAPLASGS
jgi:hypothetical protein